MKTLSSKPGASILGYGKSEKSTGHWLTDALSDTQELPQISLHSVEVFAFVSLLFYTGDLQNKSEQITGFNLLTTKDFLLFITGSSLSEAYRRNLSSSPRMCGLSAPT